MKQQNLTCVDLFAGCGGLSLGLELAGFHPIFVNELNNDAMNTYLVNRLNKNPKLNKFKEFDVKKMVTMNAYIEDLISGFKSDYKININKGDLDLLVGGPPCQGFSGIGHRRSYSVEKKQLPSNYLFEDMAFLISKLKPKIFLFENVRGLMSSRWTNDGTKGEIWDEVCETFNSIPNYTIRHTLVYAKDYGVPQNRPRVLLVGIRGDIKLPATNKTTIADGFLPTPKGIAPSINELLSDLIDRNYQNGGSTDKYINKPKNSVQEQLRFNIFNKKTLNKGDKLCEQDYSKHSDKVLKKFKYMQEHDGKIHHSMKTKKFAQRLLPAKWNGKGPTITATSLPDDYVHYKQPRILTVREWARLQMFPDWYQFCGKRTTGGIRRAGNPLASLHDRELPKYTQIGNAVPVELAHSIGKHFRKLLLR